MSKEIIFRLARKSKSINFRCPKCHARPGDPCTDKDGKTMKTSYHFDRIRRKDRMVDIRRG